MLLYTMLHVPMIWRNLLSMLKLLELGLGVDFGQNNIIITFDFDKRLVLFCQGDLFCLDSNTANGFANKRFSYSANSVHVENDSLIWYTGLGHIGAERMT